ncbi:MAG: FkbM family methyltransferase [Candidatus Nanopelagicales bacterium]
MRAPSAYQVKRVVLYPKILVGRRRERHQTGFMKSSLDRMMYSRGAYGFVAAAMDDPDLLVDVRLGPEDVALDVGAYHGTWATRVAERSPGGTIHAFELSPTEVPVLSEAVAGVGTIVVHGYGLGDADDEVVVSVSGKGSSVYHHLDTGPTERAEIRDIAGVWRDLGLSRVAVMKINIEGGEYPLLDRMLETGLLPQVDTYLIQYHEWFRGSHNGRRRIRQALSRTHTCTWDYPFVWERWDRR